MADTRPSSFVYEHCDVPEGVRLAEWRPVRPSRRAQAAGGLFAALATLTPIVLSVRGVRRR